MRHECDTQTRAGGALGDALPRPWLPIDGAHMVLSAARDAGLPAPASAEITDNRLTVWLCDALRTKNVANPQPWIDWLDAVEFGRGNQFEGSRYDLTVWLYAAESVTHKPCHCAACVAAGQFGVAL